MNGKRAKFLRTYTRNVGHDPSHKMFRQFRESTRMMDVFVGLSPQGTPKYQKMVAAPMGTIRNVGGRGYYRSLKRQFKQGNLNG